jgi:hypothetical protein
MSVRQQRKVAQALTPLLAKLFGVAPNAIENINIRFHSYPSSDFAVGGRLLQDVVPWLARLMKRTLG